MTDAATAEPKPSLTSAERAAVEQLREICLEVDGLDMKLAFEEAPATGGITCALIRHGEHLVGYASIQSGAPLEITGMVHPGHRRRGAGRHLLRELLAEVDRRRSDVLLIAEEGSVSGQAFVAAVGWQPALREHRMELELSPCTAPLAVDVEIGEVRPEDAEAYVATAALAFESEGEAAAARALSSLHIPGEQPYLFRLQTTGEPVGVARLSPEAGRAGIYGFGVVPGRRRRGIGGRMLDLLLAAARDGGHGRAVLEVAPDNAPAVRLYLSRGFTVRRTYGYYRSAGEAAAR